MKKYQIVGAIALMAVMSGSIVFAAPADKEDRAAAREDAKAAREDVIADKKAEREDAIADKKAEVEGKKVEKMCERVDKTILRLKSQSTKRKEMNADKIEKKLTQVNEKRTMQKKELQVQRQKRDEQRTVFYAAAKLKAQTDDQYAAVETFKTTVEEAIATRRASIDEATKTLRDAVDELVVTKKATIEQSYDTYAESHAKAITGAQTACGEDATADDLKAIAKDLNSELKATRTTFRNEVQAMQKIGPEVQELVAVHKASVKEAISVFKATVDAARAELLTAFDGELNIDDPAPSDAGQEDSDDEGEVEVEKE